MSLGGHLRTVGALVRRRLRPPIEPRWDEWRTTLRDESVGEVTLTGRLSAAGAGRLLIAVHGLGGSADSLYLRELAATALAADWSILRLNLRGADRRGEDFYHGGLTADLHAALASSDLAAFESVALVGYSLGGHAVLRTVTETMDERVRAAAAVCPPLDLAAGQRAIDRPGAVLYRRYVLGHVKEIYREVAARRPVPIPVADADRIETLWDWDEAIIASRYGFEGAADYYAKVSVAPRLRQLQVPALLVASDDDPMVLGASVRQHLEPPPQQVTTRWPRGSGHVAFPRRLDLGFGGPPGLPSQLLGWLAARVR